MNKFLQHLFWTLFSKSFLWFCFGQGLKRIEVPAKGVSFEVLVTRSKKTVKVICSKELRALFRLLHTILEARKPLPRDSILMSTV